MCERFLAKRQCVNTEGSPVFGEWRVGGEQALSTYTKRERMVRVYSVAFSNRQHLISSTRVHRRTSKHTYLQLAIGLRYSVTSDGIFSSRQTIGWR